MYFKINNPSFEFKLFPNNVSKSAITKDDFQIQCLPDGALDQSSGSLLDIGQSESESIASI